VDDDPHVIRSQVSLDAAAVLDNHEFSSLTPRSSRRPVPYAKNHEYDHCGHDPEQTRNRM
jgi:hypothetical protein